MNEWQPIETAPKDDGMPIIVYGLSEYYKKYKYVHLAHWEDCRNCWMFEGEDMYPTHWMPLPPAPVDANNTSSERVKKTGES
jgi:hypothetical protein